jgi:filamentous hemagglutinin family protein
MHARCLTGRLLASSSLIALAIGASASDALANPKDGKVVAGQAEILDRGNGRLEIQQTSQKAAIDWRSFSIGQQEHTHFAQPGRDAVALNRVTGDDASTIAGRLSADGRIILLNQNGILFTETAQVDVAGLIASTSRLDTRDFMADRLRFTPSANPAAQVVNRGLITVRDGGLAALVSPWVENSGTINARFGKVVLASGEAFTADLWGDGLVRLEVAEESHIRGVSHTGAIHAEGGVVALSVAEASGLVDRAINMDGVVEATRVAQVGGRILLEGGDGGSVQVAGTLDAPGQELTDRGGEVAIAAGRIELAGSASIDVSGPAGGGEARIGGAFRGAPPIPEAKPAREVMVAQGTRIDADARQRGDGGTIVVWAEDTTQFHGTATARGGPGGGHGGLVETSARRRLEVAGASIDASAASGGNGEWLLDPTDITIIDENAEAISEILNTGTDVTINTAGPGDDLGRIEVRSDAQILMSGESDATLALIADEDILIHGPINDGSETGVLTVGLTAGDDIRIEHNGDNFLGFIAVQGNVTAASTGLGPDVEESGNELIVESAVVQIDGGFIPGIAADNVNLTVAGEGPISLEPSAISADGNVTLAAGEIIATELVSGVPAHIQANGDLMLVAENGIGSPGAGLITQNVARLAARTDSGDIAIANNGSPTLTIANLRRAETGEVVAGVTILDPEDQNGLGDIALETDGDLFLGADIRNNDGADVDTDPTGSDIRLDADGAIVAAGGIITANSGALELRAGAGLGTPDAPIETREIIALTASTTTGNIRIDHIETGTRSAMALQTTDGESLSISGNDSGPEGGDIDLRVTGTDLSIGGEILNDDGGDVALSTDRRMIGEARIVTSGIQGTGQVSLTAANGMAGEGEPFSVDSQRLLATNTGDGDVFLSFGSTGVPEASLTHQGTGRLDLVVADTDAVAINGLDAPGANVSLTNDGGELDLKAIGSGTAGTLAVDAETIVLGDITSAGDQTYDGAARVDGAATLASTAGSIELRQGVEGTSAGQDDLTLSATSSNARIDVIGEIGVDQQLGTLTIDTAFMPAAAQTQNVLGIPGQPVSIPVNAPNATANRQLRVSGLDDLPPGTVLSDGVDPPVTLSTGSDTATFSNVPVLTVTLPGGTDGAISFEVQVADVDPGRVSLPSGEAFQVAAFEPDISDPASFMVTVTPPPSAPGPSVPNLPSINPGDVRGYLDEGLHFAIPDGRPARWVDNTPIIPSAAQIRTQMNQLLGQIEPAGPGESEKSKAAREQVAELEQALAATYDPWEACPEVGAVSTAWQNTPADAAFNYDPAMLPYSVDVYCGGYQLTGPARGAVRDYSGLSFVTRDFWTDRRQATTSELLRELREAFGLEE